MANLTQTRTKKLFEQTLMSLLETKSFSSITINQLCEAAHIHRSTFYRYYTDKYALLEDLVEFISADMYAKVEASKPTSRSMSEEVIGFIEANKTNFMNVITKNGNYELYEVLIKKVSAIMFDHYQDWDDDLSIKIRKSTYPEMMCHFYSSGIIEVLKRMVSSGDNYSREEFVKIIDDLIK